MLIFCVCFTNGKYKVVQSQIFNQHLSLYCGSVKPKFKTGILVLVRVLWVKIIKICWQFWHSFFKFTFKSSSIFIPLGKRRENGDGQVCLKPVPRKPWRFIHYDVSLHQRIGFTILLADMLSDRCDDVLTCNVMWMFFNAVLENTVFRLMDLSHVDTNCICSTNLIWSIGSHQKLTALLLKQAINTPNCHFQ